MLRDRDTTGDGTLDERLYGLQDPNWNVTALYADPTGAAVERYQIFGLRRTDVPHGSVYSGCASSLYEAETLYCGYRWDAIADSYLVRNRVLWAHLGRWDRRDPIENIPTLGYFGIWWFDRYEDYAYAGGRALSAHRPFWYDTAGESPSDMGVTSCVSAGTMEHKSQAPEIKQLHELCIQSSDGFKRSLPQQRVASARRNKAFRYVKADM